MSYSPSDDWHCLGQIGLAAVPLAALAADRICRHRFWLPSFTVAGAPVRKVPHSHSNARVSPLFVQLGNTK
jgi:hypothetical protein